MFIMVDYRAPLDTYDVNEERRRVTIESFNGIPEQELLPIFEKMYRSMTRLARRVDDVLAKNLEGLDLIEYAARISTCSTNLRILQSAINSQGDYLDGIQPAASLYGELKGLEFSAAKAAIQ